MIELSDFHILTDNKMNVVKDGVIPGDNIVVIKVKHNQIVNTITYIVGENDNIVKNILK